MTAQRALVAGGILNLLLVMFHMLFPVIFAWSEDLRAVSPVNTAIIYTFQSVMVFVLLAFAYLSIVHRADLVATRLGRTVLLMIGIVWLIRGVAEVIFFRLGAEVIKTVIVASQRAVLVLIGAIAYEDGQAMRAEATAATNKLQAQDDEATRLSGLFFV